MKDAIIKEAREIFNFRAALAGYAPGRVNLIGEHLDYNGGHVLPCPLDIGIYGAIAGRSDDIIRCYSGNYPEAGIVVFSLADLNYRETDGWANYVKGMVRELRPPRGFDLYVKGDIPPGAGLSSSAALEILTGTLVSALHALEYSRLELVRAAQRMENEFIGVQSGIMDQFVIAMTEKKAAMLLDTAMLSYRFIESGFGNHVLLIGNTGKARTLQASKYNERREECRRGLAILQEKYRIEHLCTLSLQELTDSAGLFTDETIFRRVRHVVSENERTLKAALALENKDVKAFGALLNESHDSLRDDYEVTGPELDTLVSLFRKHGALGARMTGAGFGGCMIALMPREGLEAALSAIDGAYRAVIGLIPEFYHVNIGKGARLL
ncbi:MAG TPA: galactokinase [Acholeplasmataceae bacterium]|jgi:galactokinase|nr:galactokinase [Acholeplasmataceae bacterium]